MQVDNQQILNLSQEVWENQLGLSIDVANGETAASDDDTLASCIQVSGPWRGPILFECSASVVRHAAAMLFASDGEETSREDLNDALQELAGMIGKKMRRLFPETVKLSRPSVVVDSTASSDVNELAGVNELNLSCEGRPVRIALLAKEQEPATA